MGEVGREMFLVAVCAEKQPPWGPGLLYSFGLCLFWFVLTFLVVVILEGAAYLSVL